MLDEACVVDAVAKRSGSGSVVVVGSCRRVSVGVGPVAVNCRGSERWWLVAVQGAGGCGCWPEAVPCRQTTTAQLRPSAVWAKSSEPGAACPTGVAGT